MYVYIYAVIRTILVIPICTESCVTVSIPFRLQTCASEEGDSQEDSGEEDHTHRQSDSGGRWGRGEEEEEGGGRGGRGEES